MDNVSINTTKISHLEIVLFFSSISGILIAAIYSNYNSEIARSIFYISLASFFVSFIFRISRPSISYPLIEDRGDFAYFYKFKKIPFIGLISTSQEKINWNDISALKGTHYPSAQGHGAGAFWYCIERKDRSITENFLGTEYADSVYGFIRMIRNKKNDIEFDLTNIEEN